MKRTSDDLNEKYSSSSVDKRLRIGPSKKRKGLAKNMVSDDIDVIKKFMRVYEEIRRKDVEKEQKHHMIDEILILINGKENSVIFKHDCVRVLECCVKFGTSEHRQQISSIYKDHSLDLLKSKYGKHLVKRLVKYGNKPQRDLVIKSFYGHVAKLVKQREASRILEFIYHQYADSVQRITLLQEFYGPQYIVLKDVTGMTLQKMLKEDSDQKNKILKHLKETLIPLAGRDSVELTVVQRPLLDYFTFADDSMKADMAGIFGNQVVKMLHTYEGSRVAMHCIWSGSTKDRKVIIKSLKPFTMKICLEEYGHLVLLAIFDVVDDTVFVKKTLLSEINENMDGIIQNIYGRKVLLYLLKSRDRRFFTPECISLLEKGDRNTISKKENKTRQNELRKGILDPLVKYIIGNVEEILKDKSKCQIILSALEHSSDCALTTDIFNAITNLAAALPQVDSDEEDYIIFHPCAHWVVKRLVQQDRARVDNGETSIFCKILFSGMKKGFIGKWIQHNRGAFVVVSLLETEIPDIADYVLEELNVMSPIPKTEKSKGLEIIQKITGLKFW